MPLCSEHADAPVGSRRDPVSAGGRAKRAPRSQAVSSEVSEHIAELAGLLGETGDKLFICEGGGPACSRPLEIAGA